MKRGLLAGLIAVCGAFWLAQTASAAVGAAENGETGGAGHSLNPLVLVGVAVILIVAKVGGELFERAGQPAVLGELIGGILVGNLALAGLPWAEPLKTNEVIAALAEIGVILLLFEVGLESDLGEMMKVGWSSLLVAVAGVVAPFFLGWGVAAYFLPGEARLGHIFIGAVLCATSVGITARVLKDMRKLVTREARIILGAAVIDDVLGLLILAVIAGAIKAASAGASLSLFGVGMIALKAVLFLTGALVAGHFVLPRLLRGVGRFESRGVLLTISISFCFLLAWAASLVELAPIVGAFAAGLVLDEVHFHSAREHKELSLEKLLVPVTTLFVPIFFVLMGLKVDLRAFARVDLLGFALALTLAAIIGKQVCSLVVIERGVNRLSVGLGMIPRGEVGLIFAGIGATLMLPSAATGTSEPVINAATFGVVVIMVIITTLVTPPALKWSLGHTRSSFETGPPAEALREVAEDAAERSSQ
ncbi:MAG TPA: cation:proton antiporter [Pyrinomonadaceae bacterium]|jgi:Kef-type K+ transport system membrane component KefB